MEGRGVTNYNAEKPAFAISTETTEFDDELIKRGIVTLETAMLRKGASLQEAQRLVDLRRNGATKQQQEQTISKNDRGEFGDDSSSNVDEDEFLSEYRQSRLLQLKGQRQGPYYGQIVPISRPDWTREVNDASQDGWVVVTLTSSNIERTGCAEAAVAELATKFTFIKFVAIPSHAAIPNWPDENLPTIFCYRHGRMQHQLVQLSSSLSTDQLEWKLAQLEVLETNLDEEPMIEAARQKGPGIQYRGTVAQYRVDDDDAFDNNYDNVD